MADPARHPILTLPAVVHVLNEINGGQEWAEAFARAIPQSSIRRREKEADIRRGGQPRMLLADEHDHDEEERRRVWLGRTQVAAAHAAAARDISFTRSTTTSGGSRIITRATHPAGCYPASPRAADTIAVIACSAVAALASLA